MFHHLWFEIHLKQQCIKKIILWTFLSVLELIKYLWRMIANSSLFFLRFLSHRIGFTWAQAPWCWTSTRPTTTTPSWDSSPEKTRIQETVLNSVSFSRSFYCISLRTNSCLICLLRSVMKWSWLFCLCSETK